ncbi:hypothetical protein Acr_03g0008810 [Actinidia rufa]|uniref:Uncharacterized protein n=1 Tax=Actinidia rufa TaxID=165716 RepID=A0A7J0EEP4_9ERIC|nr:hypothetical protein Acr_03g0008810 [Actinidia rufa]
MTEAEETSRLHEKAAEGETTKYLKTMAAPPWPLVDDVRERLMELELELTTELETTSALSQVVVDWREAVVVIRASRERGRRVFRGEEVVF